MNVEDWIANLVSASSNGDDHTQSNAHGFLTDTGATGLLYVPQRSICLLPISTNEHTVPSVVQLLAWYLELTSTLMT